MTQPIFDGEGRLFESDPETGKQVWMLDEGDKIRIRTVMPVDDLLDENAAMQTENLGKRWGDGAVVARVPMHVWQRQLAPAIHQDDKAYVSRWLNDSDHARFRTRGGRI